MKKTLAILIGVCMFLFYAAHTYEHAKGNVFFDELHSSGFNDHTHLGSELVAFNVQEHRHGSPHKHLDDLFVRSVREKRIKEKLAIFQTFITQKNWKNLFESGNLKKPKEYILSTYCHNHPFVSRNQPLLI